MSFSSFLNRFKRVTSSGDYMPELDGLRFVALVLVVGVIHLGNLICITQLGSGGMDPNNIFYIPIQEGSYGLPMFFVISAFILSLPFARQKLLNTSQPISLKKYYWRRVTRIEPPYIITMLLFFAMRVWVLHYDSFRELLSYLFASLFYVHNFVYQSASAINGVAWSLEVEVQFYLLAPLLCYVYYIRNKYWRRGLLLFLIIISAIFSYVQQYHYADLLNKGCFFLEGMLLADCYILRKKEYNGKPVAFMLVTLFLGFLFVPLYYVSVYLCVLKTLATMLFVYVAITNDVLKKALSVKVFTIIGGMCYSIYLIHMGVLGVLRHRFMKIKFFHNIVLDILSQYIISIVVVLIISSIFFLLVEKPTMKKDWYRNLFRKKQAAL
jgi:peptidoglycan/LPS O-acetylase OafA/YrhL